MPSDYNEDRAYEMGDPTRTRYLQEDDEEEPMGIYIRHEFRNESRRPLWTEDELVEQEQRRIEACRDLDRSRTLDAVFNVCGYLLVVGVVLATCTALLAGVAYASQWLYRVLIG